MYAAECHVCGVAGDYGAAVEFAGYRFCGVDGFQGAVERKTRYRGRRVYGGYDFPHVDAAGSVDCDWRREVLDGAVG